MITVFPFSSIMQPGAVPLGLGMMMLFSGRYACFSLF